MSGLYSHINMKVTGRCMSAKPHFVLLLLFRYV